MFETVGYALIKKSTTTGTGAPANKIKNFEDKYCRVMEFADDGGALVLNPSGDMLCMFDACDIVCKFTCTVLNDVIIPPNFDGLDRLQYYTKAVNRKGGYNDILKNMVIVASCAKNTFTDTFLWQKQ